MTLLRVDINLLTQASPICRVYDRSAARKELVCIASSQITIRKEFILCTIRAHQGVLLKVTVPTEATPQKVMRHTKKKKEKERRRKTRRRSREEKSYIVML
jgi:hypothetical protein